MSAWAQGRMTMSRHPEALHHGMNNGMLAVGVALVAGQRARREAQAWAQADADAESAVHRLGQALLASRRREVELSLDLAAAQAEIRALRLARRQ